MASTSTHTVASGISRRDRDSLSAIALRTPVIGMRCTAGDVDGTVAAGAASACSTSRRMTRPFGPLPRTEARSSPLSRAIRRTSGETTATRPATGATSVFTTRVGRVRDARCLRPDDSRVP